MRIGLVLPLASSDAGRVLSFARRAEELGFDGLFAFDHLFPPGAPADRPSFEAYATLAAVGAITSRVRIGTLVTRAVLRSPGLLGKQAVALDDISGGRFVLGIGTGDRLSEAEHVAFGLPSPGREARAQHLAETVRALRALFGGQPFGGGRHVPPIAGPLLPRPRTGAGPPIWIGGTSAAAAHMAAQQADGWNGWGLDVSGFAEGAALVRARSGGRPVEATWGGVVVVAADDAQARRLARERRDRGLMPATISGDPDRVSGWLLGLADAGATWAILLAAGGPDRVEILSERVLPRVASGR
jgi:alkanesulfonate monooxygenase SsuD/methylene tetrahydromethanopterin reductase-like flavin-dependent oxidoreductase (luciferase family)